MTTYIQLPILGKCNLLSLKPCNSIKLTIAGVKRQYQKLPVFFGENVDIVHGYNSTLRNVKYKVVY